MRTLTLLPLSSIFVPRGRGQRRSVVDLAGDAGGKCGLPPGSGVPLVGRGRHRGDSHASATGAATTLGHGILIGELFLQNFAIFFAQFFNLP